MYLWWKYCLILGRKMPPCLSSVLWSPFVNWQDFCLFTDISLLVSFVFPLVNTVKFWIILHKLSIQTATEEKCKTLCRAAQHQSPDEHPRANQNRVFSSKCCKSKVCRVVVQGSINDSLLEHHNSVSWFIHRDAETFLQSGSFRLNQFSFGFWIKFG